MVSMTWKEVPCIFCFGDFEKTRPLSDETEEPKVHAAEPRSSFTKRSGCGWMHSRRNHTNKPEQSEGKLLLVAREEIPWFMEPPSDSKDNTGAVELIAEMRSSIINKAPSNAHETQTLTRHSPTSILESTKILELQGNSDEAARAKRKRRKPNLTAKW